MQAVKRGGDRQELHEEIRRLSHETAKKMKAEGTENDLIDRIVASGIFNLTRGDIDGILEPTRYTGRASEQVADVVGQYTHRAFPATGCCAGQAGELHRDEYRKDLAERIPAFYARYGYIDMEVLGDTIVVAPPLTLSHRGLPLFLMVPADLPASCGALPMPNAVVLAHDDTLYEAVSYACHGGPFLYSHYALREMRPDGTVAASLYDELAAADRIPPEPE